MSITQQALRARSRDQRRRPFPGGFLQVCLVLVSFGGGDRTPVSNSSDRRRPNGGDIYLASACCNHSAPPAYRLTSLRRRPSPGPVGFPSSVLARVMRCRTHGSTAESSPYAPALSSYRSDGVLEPHSFIPSLARYGSYGIPCPGRSPCSYGSWVFSCCCSHAIPRIRGSFSSKTPSLVFTTSPEIRKEVPESTQPLMPASAG